jgi:hypothetical protein
MILTILMILCMIIAGLSYLRCRHLEDDDLVTGWGCSFIASLVFVIALAGAHMITIGVNYYSQIDDIESVKRYTNVEKIYQEKADALTTQFASYLAEAYPKHEKDIFNQIKPEKIGLYMVKYPELQASATFVALVGQIGKLQSDKYEQRVKKEEALKDIRVRIRNPWVFTSWLPTE